MSFLSFLTVSETDRNDNLRRFVIKNEALIIREKGFFYGFLRTFEKDGEDVRGKSRIFP